MRQIQEQHLFFNKPKQTTTTNKQNNTTCSLSLEEIDKYISLHLVSYSDLNIPPKYCENRGPRS